MTSEESPPERAIFPDLNKNLDPLGTDPLGTDPLGTDPKQERTPRKRTAKKPASESQLESSSETEQAQAEPAQAEPSQTVSTEASKPRIGDSRPAPEGASNDKADSPEVDKGEQQDGAAKKRRRRKRGQGSGPVGADDAVVTSSDQNDVDSTAQADTRRGANADESRHKSSNRSATGQNNKKRNSSKAAENTTGTAGQKNDGPKKGAGRSSKHGNEKQSGGAKQGNAQRSNAKQKNKQGKGQGRGNSQPIRQVVADAPVELNEKQLKRRRGRSRKGRPVGRYMMVVSKRQESTHIAVVEGRQLVEYVVSRPADDVAQIHGNIYLGRVQNVLPGMEAAFVDIGTPKNAVLYRADVSVPGVKSKGRGNQGGPKIEELLKPRQMVLCQVTKNPIAHKGARLTMEVSLPGRFVVLVPNSETYGISKRLPDPERKRLRQLLDRIRPKGHGLIVRTAAENVTAEEIERDIIGLQQQWDEIEQLAKRTQKASLVYREPDLSTRLIREEFNKEYRAVIIDDAALYGEISDYVSVITPALADRVEHYDKTQEPISVFERYHVHEQLHKAIDRKVWLPSGGSLIIEATEALTVIDVNTGKNVGSSSLEETVFNNNVEAAVEVAHQLRLRDIGGIIVIDFVDMEDRKNREKVMKVFREALGRDKTRTQVFGISDLGLVEMTRKRIGEGLVESLSGLCPDCDGRGLLLNQGMIDKLRH